MDLTLGQTLLLLYVAWFLAGWLVMRLLGRPMGEEGMAVILLGPLIALLFIGLPPEPTCQRCGHRQRAHFRGGPPSPRRCDHPCSECDCRDWTEQDGTA
jgi:hypothetical protein